jgi:HEAT repeat protein
MNQARLKNDSRKAGAECDFVIACMKGDSDVAAFEAAKRVRRQPDSRLLRPLIHLLERGRTSVNRAAAAYALSDLSSDEAIVALERTVADKSEDPKVRGFAAEALAHHHRRESHRVLLRNVTDPCEEVRFWCAFALGEMTKVDALRLLRSLSRKERRIVGRGSRFLAEEPVGAIGSIQQKLSDPNWPCPFCVAS